MLRFNTFRARKYLRSKFVEGKFLLASEATDLELELIDLLRRQIRTSIGNIAVENAWKATYVSATQMLIQPGEAWQDGLPLVMRFGKDHLVSGNLLSSGILPAFTTITDDPTGQGKLVTFNVGGSTPTGIYRVVITAQEQVVTDNDDLFLKNANLTEDTAQKIRLVYKINLVSNALQTETPIPYTNDTNQANLVNQIIVTPTAAGNGELLNTTAITGSEQIDGRNVEITLRNDNTIGGGNPIPNGSSDQAAFANGRLIDSNGTEYHVNAVFNATLSTEVIIRLSKEFGQSNPEIINTKPFILKKRDVFVSDDVNGTPQGKLFYNVATVDYNSVSGIESASKITDLRIVDQIDSTFEEETNQKIDFYITGGGDISLDASSTLLSWTGAFHILNAYGSLQTIAPNTVALLDGGALVYTLNFSGGALGRGNQSVTIATGGSTLTLSGSPNLSLVRVGNVIQCGSQYSAITAIDDVNDTLTVSPSMSNTGAATIYRDSFAAGTAPLATESIVLAVRDGLIVKVAKSLTLNAGDSSPLGGASPIVVRQNKNLKLINGGTWSFDGGTGDLTFDADAQIQVPGLPDARNNILPQTIPLPNNDDVAYVQINRTGSTPDNLTVQVAQIASLVMDDNTVVIARRVGGGAILAQQTNDSAGDALDNSASQALANSFVVSSATTITNIDIELTRVGSPVGNITVSLQGDSGGSPDGVPLESTSLLASSVNAFPTNTTVSLTTSVPVAAGTYHIVIETDATYKSGFSVFNFVSVRRFAPGGPAPHEERYNGTTWSTDLTAALYYIVTASGSAPTALVGTSSFALGDGESKPLDQGTTDQNLQLLGSGITRSTASPNYSSNIRGVSGQGFQERLGVLTDSMGDAQEDKSAYLRSDVPVTWTGLQLQFTQNIVLEIVNTKSGTVTQHTILTANSPIALNNGESAWVMINRTAASENLTVFKSGITPIPAQTQANKDVVVIARRVDANTAGYLHIPLHKQVLEPGQTVRLGASGAGGSGGVGDNLNSLNYKVSFTDDFSKLPDAALPIDFTAGHTDSNTYSVVNQYYRLAYDAAKTITGTGTSMNISATPSFTIKAGDVIRIGVEVRRITNVSTQTSVTIESAFSTDPSAAASTISQALYTKDLNAFAGDGLAPSSVFTDDISSLLMFYRDSSTADDIIQDNGVPPHVAYTASADGVNYSPSMTRTTNLSDAAQSVGLYPAGQNLYIRFFANKSSGSGFVNLLDYKVFFHRETAEESATQKKFAYARTDGFGLQINCSLSVVAGKTRVRLLNGLTYPAGLENGGYLKVLADGVKLPLFIDSVTTPDGSWLPVDATTFDLDSDYSALDIGLEILLDPPVIDSSPDNAAAIDSMRELWQEKFQNSLKDSNLLVAVNGAPNEGQFRSDITGRASIIDPKQDLLPRMGINRIPVASIYPIADESGPSGQAVNGVTNDKYNQIRFVGTWVTLSDVNGTRANSNSSNDYVEVVFYGTGLNVLVLNQATDLRVSIDGGVEGSNLFSASASTALNTRNYGTNVILKAASGLTLGVHTAKLRANAAAMVIYGFEVVTQSSTLQIPAGSAFASGKKLTHALLESIAYGSGFESGSLASKGGRVIAYMKADGSIAKSARAANASQLNLSSADHSNEEVLHNYHFREFGAGKGDDFSSIAGGPSDRAFTLSDGTTTLIAHNGNQLVTPTGYDVFYTTTAGVDYVLITFVGTGLDVIITSHNNTTGNSPNQDFIIDGVTVSTSQLPITPYPTRAKIVSGLSYGTHTVKIAVQSGGSGVTGDIAYKDFIVYGPKKPDVPGGAVELADYNVLANFVANATADLVHLSTGTLRKVSNREYDLVGTWTLAQPDIGDKVGGSTVYTNTNGDYAEYTFFGTGFDMRYLAKTGRTTAVQFSLNGTALTTANFPSAIFTAYGGTTSYNASSGELDQSNSGDIPGAGFTVSSLPLALYTVRLTNTQSNFMTFDTMDIIVPIHAAKWDSQLVLQNDLGIGSQSLEDKRHLSVHPDLPENKASAMVIGIVSGTTSSLTTYVPIIDMITALKCKGGLVEISYSATIENSAGNNGANLAIFVDGKQVSAAQRSLTGTASRWSVMSDRIQLQLAKGRHTIAVCWASDSGANTMTGLDLGRSLSVREL